MCWMNVEEEIVQREKTLQRCIKYPQLSSWIIDQWAEQCVQESFLATLQVWVSIYQVGAAKPESSTVLHRTSHSPVWLPHNSHIGVANLKTRLVNAPLLSTVWWIDQLVAWWSCRITNLETDNTLTLIPQSWFLPQESTLKPSQDYTFSRKTWIGLFWGWTRDESDIYCL